ncbi:MAG: GTP 3',8-cyclase MoaA [Oscillospiraceae bacterium]
MKDSFGREISYMRLSVTELCNLRCRYCMPEEGVCKKKHGEMLTEEEMLLAVKIAAEHGVRKLRITGGEPLVKPNILSICRRAADVPGIEELCLTTNGTLLKDLARPLCEAGVQHINISLDTLNQEKYAHITRRGSLQDALDGVEAALTAGFRTVKLNAVLIGGFNDDEIPELARLTLKYPLDVRFIELMPMLSNEMFGAEAYLPNSRVPQMLPELEYEKSDGVASLYHLPRGLGKVGLISPLSHEFCGSCSRIRLTADGKLRPCLHSDVEFPIKDLDEDGMRRQFEKAIMAKPARHGLLSAESRSLAGRDMNTIGG